MARDHLPAEPKESVMRMLLIAGVLAGLGPAAVRAEPVQLDENGLRAVAAGAETAAAPISLKLSVQLRIWNARHNGICPPPGERMTNS